MKSNKHRNAMFDRKSVLLLTLIMGLATLIVGGIAISLLYQAAFEQQRLQLQEEVQGHARLVESVAHFDSLYSQEDHPGGSFAATLSQVRAAHDRYEQAGNSRAFLIGQRQGNRIKFLLHHQNNTAIKPLSVPWDINIAEPMQRALKGESGIMQGQDLFGTQVLAAYEPVAILNLGMVAKIDMAEFRAPFIRAGSITLLIALAIITLGTTIFRRVGGDIIQQLTQQANTIEKNRKSLTRAQQIAHVGNWEWNIATGELDWSDEIYRIFGLQPQEHRATYEAFLRVIHPDDQMAVQNAVSQAIEQHQPYRIEHRIIRPNGEQGHVLERGEVFYDEDGNAVHMTGTILDITERKKAEEQLLLSDRVFKNTSEAIIITSANGDIIDVNQAFVDITGWSRDEVIGQNPSLMRSDRQDPAFYESMWQHIHNHGWWSGEIWDRKKSGEDYPKWLTINAVKNEQGEISHYIGIFSDITRAKATELQLQQMAFYDSLTGLPNRTLCRERLEQELKNARRNSKKVALLFLDLDRFKDINDTLGHSAGDLLLVQASQRLKRCIRESDTVARLGGDEFNIILGDIGSVQAIQCIAEKIIECLARPFVVQGQEINIGGSIGISLFPENGADYDTLTKCADTAMYKAKDAGRNTFHFFTDEMQAAIKRRLLLEKELRIGLRQENGLSLHYQPKVNMQTGHIVGMEALLRWNHPTLGYISPNEVIPVAEDTGLIQPLGEWVLHQACQQNAAWIAAGYPPLRVAVNLSNRQFEHKDITESIQHTLMRTGLDPEYLELEITESMVMRDAEKAIVILHRLRQLGIQIAMDDFGTGYSSLAYLKQLPIHSLKIDKSFVDDIGKNGDAATIASTIISMAGRLNLKVVAEGIETQEQMEYLRDEGCDEMQGYYYSHPLAADSFVQLLGEEKKPSNVMKFRPKRRSPSQHPA